MRSSSAIWRSDEAGGEREDEGAIFCGLRML